MFSVEPRLWVSVVGLTASVTPEATFHVWATPPRSDKLELIVRFWVAADMSMPPAPSVNVSLLTEPMETGPEGEPIAKLKMLLLLAPRSVDRFDVEVEANCAVSAAVGTWDGVQSPAVSHELSVPPFQVRTVARAEQASPTAHVPATTATVRRSNVNAVLRRRICRFFRRSMCLSSVMPKTDVDVQRAYMRTSVRNRPHP
jgi:hypothetical protein